MKKALLFVVVVLPFFIFSQELRERIDYLDSYNQFYKIEKWIKNQDSTSDFISFNGKKYAGFHRNIIDSAHFTIIEDVDFNIDSSEIIKCLNCKKFNILFNKLECLDIKNSVIATLEKDTLIDIENVNQFLQQKEFNNFLNYHKNLENSTISTVKNIYQFEYQELIKSETYKNQILDAYTNLEYYDFHTLISKFQRIDSVNDFMLISKDSLHWNQDTTMLTWYHTSVLDSILQITNFTIENNILYLKVEDEVIKQIEFYDTINLIKYTNDMIQEQIMFSHNINRTKQGVKIKRIKEQSDLLEYEYVDGENWNERREHFNKNLNETIKVTHF